MTTESCNKKRCNNNIVSVSGYAHVFVLLSVVIVTLSRRSGVEIGKWIADLCRSRSTPSRRLFRNSHATTQRRHPISPFPALCSGRISCGGCQFIAERITSAAWHRIPHPSLALSHAATEEKRRHTMYIVLSCLVRL